MPVTSARLPGGIPPVLMAFQHPELLWVVPHSPRPAWGPVGFAPNALITAARGRALYIYLLEHLQYYHKISALRADGDYGCNHP